MRFTKYSYTNYLIYGWVILTFIFFYACDKNKPAANEMPNQDKIVTFRPPWTRCDERDGFIAYLRSVGEKTVENWKLPITETALPIPYRVSIEFSINEDGSLREASAPGDEDERLKESALTAIRTADLGPLPDNLKCISEMEGLGVTIRHPSSPN